MTTVVMGPALDLPRAHGQQRGRPVEGLDLGLLVDTQDQSPLGWVEVEPHDVTDLLDEQRVNESFVSVCGGQTESRTFQTRVTTRSTSVSVMERGPPGRGRQAGRRGGVR